MHFAKTILIAAAVAASAACGSKKDAASSDPYSNPDAPKEVAGLQTPAAFLSIKDDEERSAAIFAEMAKVMLHPRCANCHPRNGAGPTQGDDMSPHNPPVVRGDGMGAAGMECNTCHGAANVEFASGTGSIPGATPWMLAPASMGWAGATAAELCAQIKNRETNGGRSLEDLVKHNGGDHLVGWAWNPGDGRTPAPGSQETFGALTRAWAESGGHCPT